jgi:hypothetical protein
MAFHSKDLMASLVSFQNPEATACPEFTITPSCTNTITNGPGLADSDGLSLLQQQLRMALGQPAV